MIIEDYLVPNLHKLIKRTVTIYSENVKNKTFVKTYSCNQCGFTVSAKDYDELANWPPFTLIDSPLTKHFHVSHPNGPAMTIHDWLPPEEKNVTSV